MDNKTKQYLVNMTEKIAGLKSAYEAALDRRGHNMEISATLVCEIVERMNDLENTMINLQTSLRNCQSQAMQQWNTIRIYNDRDSG